MIVVAVQGIETSQFREQSTRNQHVSTGQKKVSQVPIISQRQVIHEFHNPIEPGLYSFNFLIELPDWLPLSMRVSPVPESIFSVDYKVNA